jgi:hypothetical protein
VIRSTEAECDIAGVFCINNFLTWNSKNMS